jgi:hypothetical protein
MNALHSDKRCTLTEGVVLLYNALDIVAAELAKTAFLSAHQCSRSLTSDGYIGLADKGGASPDDIE